MKIAYIAHSCSPYHGSEARIGWRIPLEAAFNNEVLVMTVPESKELIEKYAQHASLKNVRFFYIDVPSAVKKICKGPLFSLRLMVWNCQVKKELVRISKKERIDVIHQLNPVEFRAIGNYGTLQPHIPYVCGPVGGGRMYS